MKVHYQLGKQSYQLNQRGVNISPVFELVIAKHELTKQQNNEN
jgi:hypothetical protein